MNFRTDKRTLTCFTAGILVGVQVFAEPVNAHILTGTAICIAAVLFMVASERKK